MLEVVQGGVTPEATRREQNQNIGRFSHGCYFIGSAPRPCAHPWQGTDTPLRIHPQRILENSSHPASRVRGVVSLTALKTCMFRCGHSAGESRLGALVSPSALLSSSVFVPFE